MLLFDHFYIITYPKLFCQTKLFYCSFWLEILTKVCLSWFIGGHCLVGGAWSKTHNNKMEKKKFKMNSRIALFGKTISYKLLNKKWPQKVHKQSIALISYTAKQMSASQTSPKKSTFFWRKSNLHPLFQKPFNQKYILDTNISFVIYNKMIYILILNRVKMIFYHGCLRCSSI